MKAQSEIFSREKNTKIEILDQVPCHAVISVAGRVAPLMLEFEFYERNGVEEVMATDVIVCISATNKFPSVDDCIESRKMLCKDKMTMYYYNGKEQRGEVFPKYDINSEYQHKVSFPQELYVSLYTMRHYHVAITVSFPIE